MLYTRVSHALQMMRARLLRGVLNVTRTAECTRTVHTAQLLLGATNAPDSSIQLSAAADAISKHDANAAFLDMMRTSALVRMGDVNGRVLVGRVVHTRADDLYVDFGGKFNCVVRRPRNHQNRYNKGVLVLVRVHDTELSSRFLGSDVDMTLLEADATLVGLYDKKVDSDRQTAADT